MNHDERSANPGKTSRYARVNLIKDRLVQIKRASVSTAQSLSPKPTGCEPDPTALKRAKALDRILRRMPVYIETTALGGKSGEQPRSAPIFPEYSVPGSRKNSTPLEPGPAIPFRSPTRTGGAPSALPLLERENAPGSRVRPSTRRGAQSDRDRRGGVGGKRDRRRRPYNTHYEKLFEIGLEIFARRRNAP